MSEEDQTNNEQPTEDSGRGDLGEAKELLEQTNSAAERLEKANAKKEELLQREERIKAQSGGTMAGQGSPKKEEPLHLKDPVGFSKKVFSGEENIFA